MWNDISSGFLYVAALPYYNRCVKTAFDASSLITLNMQIQNGYMIVVKQTQVSL